EDEVLSASSSLSRRRRWPIEDKGTMSHKRQSLLVLAVLSAGLHPLLAKAQDSYPSRPIQVIVTTAAGGALDLVARTLAGRPSETLQQPLIIENQPAANGSVAAGQFVEAAPDGHRLMMVVDSTVTINPSLYKHLKYDAFKDFAPVSLVSRLSLV